MTGILESIAPMARGGRPLGDLVARLTDAGYEVHLVGGSVRDALLGVSAVDLDVATDARPERVRSLVEGWADALWLQGQRFGTVGMVRNGVTIEITTYRADVYHAESRKPTVTYSDTIEADLARRDFTVNAMAVALPSLELVDPFNGRDDLVARRLRTPQAADLSFADDPLRMLRAARFASTYGLVPDPEVVDAMKRLRRRLGIVSAERIHGELVKLLLSGDPTPGFDLLASTGLQAEFLPEAIRAADLVRVAPDEVRRFAVLFADVEPTVVKRRMDSLRCGRAVTADVVKLLRLTVRAHALGERPTVPQVRELALDAHTLRPAWVDVVGVIGRVPEVRSLLAALEQSESIDGPDSPFDGDAVMNYLGIPPGRAVGDALRALRRARVTQGPLDRIAAEGVLDEWAQDR